MNMTFSNEQVYDAINTAGNDFFSKMTGSEYWRIKENEIVSEQYDISGIQIRCRIKEFMKPDRTPVLPQDPINPDWLRAGSYFGEVEIKIPGENKFSIHAPHNKPEDQVHIQKGRDKIILPPYDQNITDYGLFGSGLFLKFYSRDEAIKRIQEIREK